MDTVYECFCDGQLDELISFLKIMEQFMYVVMSTGSHGTTALTDRTLKNLAYEIRNNTVVCPVHYCKINVDHLRDDLHRDSIHIKKRYKK